MSFDCLSEVVSAMFEVLKSQFHITEWYQIIQIKLYHNSYYVNSILHEANAKWQKSHTLFLFIKLSQQPYYLFPKPIKRSCWSTTALSAYISFCYFCS